MYRIIDGRGTGKTSRLLTLAKDNNAILVCSNPRAMQYKAKSYGIDGVETISYGEFLNEHQDSHKQYVIDEIEKFMGMVYGEQTILGYTLSTE